jgi:hypothetical protein
LRIFVDSSALFKKYVNESGREKFLSILENTTVIVVAPVCLLEMGSALNRLLREKVISLEQKTYIEPQIQNDFHYFEKVVWSQQLEVVASGYIEKFGLKTLDAIQLASAHLADIKFFVTSDKKLHHCSKLVIKEAVLV